MYEIELKAWLDDHGKTVKMVGEFAEYSGSTDKKDTYWKQGNQCAGFAAAAGTSIVSAGNTKSTDIPAKKQVQAPADKRVRIRFEEHTSPQGEVSLRTLVTYKHKEMRGDIEVNNETEFVVSDGGEFETFLTAIGFLPDTSKHKSTESWQYGDALIEISEVEGLGNFIEIEILCQTQEPDAVASRRAKLFYILALAGVPESAVETRYYTEMLRN